MRKNSPRLSKSTSSQNGEQVFRLRSWHDLLNVRRESVKENESILFFIVCFILIALMTSHILFVSQIYSIIDPLVEMSKRATEADAKLAKHYMKIAQGLEFRMDMIEGIYEDKR